MEISVKNKNSFIWLFPHPEPNFFQIDTNSNTHPNLEKGQEELQSVLRIRIQISMDPHHFGKMDPDSHQGGNLDPNPGQSENPDPHESEKVEAL
jgi:hypothetical protein